MEVINLLFEKYTESILMMSVLAITVFVIFKLISSKVSYIIIRIFKGKVKNKKEITEHGFYKPLSNLISVFGLYVAIMLLRIPLKMNIETIEFINTVFKIIVILLVSKGAADTLTTKSNFFKKLAKKSEHNIDDASINVIIKIIRGAIYIIAAFIIILEIGYDLSGLIAGLGIGSIVITLAAQDTAKSLLGGLIIAIDKPFKVGDWISIPQCEGIVEEITFRCTRIRNINNSIVSVPNSTMMQSIITNSSANKNRRFDTKIILKNDTSLENIKMFEDSVISMLESDENVINPTIWVYLDKIAGGGFEIIISATTNIAEYEQFLVTKEELNYKILNIITEKNLNIA